MKQKNFPGIAALRVSAVLLGTIMMAGTLIVSSCGGGSDSAGTSQAASTNVSEDDVQRGLKFDSRVKDFDTDGDKLVINVNEYWQSSPSGLQERALQKWFSQWQSARSGGAAKPPKGTEVVVKYEGDDVARATLDKGVQILGKSAPKAEGS
jgi:hypothetical protein